MEASLSKQNKRYQRLTGNEDSYLGHHGGGGSSHSDAVLMSNEDITTTIIQRSHHNNNDSVEISNHSCSEEEARETNPLAAASSSSENRPPRSGGGGGGIFRTHKSWDGHIIVEGNISRQSSLRAVEMTPSGASSLASHRPYHDHPPTVDKKGSDVVDTQGGDDNINNTNNVVQSASSPPRNMMSRSCSLESDWEVEEEAGLRRYHLEFARPADIPMPAEFSQPDNIYDLISGISQKVWRHFLALRTAARQRRAARLLTMPSESWKYKLRACILTYCCDATDAGILLVACGILLWIFLGFVARMGSRWWTCGILLFGIRVTARRTYELFCQQYVRHGGLFAIVLGKTTARPRLPTMDLDAAVVVGGGGGGGVVDSSYWKDSRSDHGSKAGVV